MSPGALAGRVALVTGGSRGIGRGVSEALLADDATLVVTYVRDRDSAEDFARSVAAEGGKITVLRSDVADPEASQEAVRRTVEQHGRLDVLVSSGGIASSGRSVVETPPEELERVLRVHAFGPHHLCQAALPPLRESGGHIIFISSIGANTFVPGGAPYSMGKAAVEALAHTLAREERANGVRVNIVAPGLVRTEMGRRLVRATLDVDIDDLGQQSPFGRVCTPDDVGRVVRFLVGKDADYVNDQRIVVDGGSF